VNRGSPFPTVLLAFLTVIALFALTGYQVTSETAATRLLSRLAAALIEVDRWLPPHLDDLNLLARDRPDGFVRVPDVPIAVTLPAGQVLSADEESVRSLLLDRMGDELYAEGNGAFVDAAGRARSPGIDEPVHWTVALLDRSMHGVWRVLLPAALVTLLAAVGGMLYLGRNVLPAMIAGGLGGAAGAFLPYLLAGLASRSFGSPVDQEIALIFRDGAWLGLRNCLSVSAVALGLLLLLRVLSPEGLTWSRRVRPPEPPEASLFSDQ
jgi:hypothetical protein